MTISKTKTEMESDNAIENTSPESIACGQLNSKWSENLTNLDLSDMKLTTLQKVELPQSLLKLNLSHNNFKNVPIEIINLEKIIELNISYNSIENFNETPGFSQSIESLDISNNCLLCPPIWIWTQSPIKLKTLNISNNYKVAINLQNELFNDLEYTNTISELIINNCKLAENLILLNMFPSVKSLKLGCSENNIIYANQIYDLPFKGLENLCNLEYLDVSLTNVYNVLANIDRYKNLIEINLSNNNIDRLPKEFCNLANLKVCILSYNKLLYLPDDITKLKSLVRLCVDSNRLCLLPELWNLPQIEILDLYDNELYELDQNIKSIRNIDVALNYFNEPNDEDYIHSRNNLRQRLGCSSRVDGRKVDAPVAVSEYSSRTSDDESESVDVVLNNDDIESVSSEDWDDDEYWTPHYTQVWTPPESPWVFYARKKMQEGCFCPMDIHTVPIAEKVKYLKSSNPKIEQEVDGQFDSDVEEDS